MIIYFLNYVSHFNFVGYTGSILMDLCSELVLHFCLTCGRPVIIPSLASKLFEGI